MEERISVIVPVYNIAAELKRCIDSILAQTYSNIEIIAIDDGSSDESGFILDEYENNYPNIHVFHKKNGGVTSARLRGIEEATGVWIGFVDGDDEIEPDMYERLIRNATRYKADISHCGYQMIFNDGRIHYFHNTGHIVEQDSTAALRELLSGAMIEPGLCNKLYRKTLFTGLFRNNTIPNDIKINEDLLMNYYLFSGVDKAVFEDWCPYHYIVRNDSASRVKLNHHRIYDPIRVKKMILKSVPDEIKMDARRALVSTCVYTYCSLVLEKDMDVKEAKRYVRAMLREHKDWCKLLAKRTYFLAKMIIQTPHLFKMVYPLFVRFFQTSKYA